MAPGVGKEPHPKQFDCYNLAAIGRTTRDYPFTPSWRLIGGYWKWGRKARDENQWYDTNTPHFAHGPTGPDSGDANSESVDDWDSSDAPDLMFQAPVRTQVATSAQDIIIETGNLDAADTILLFYQGECPFFAHGTAGRYWSSFQDSGSNAWFLSIYGQGSDIDNFDTRINGHSIRSISARTRLWLRPLITVSASDPWFPETHKTNFHDLAEDPWLVDPRLACISAVLLSFCEKKRK